MELTIRQKELLKELSNMQAFKEKAGFGLSIETSEIESIRIREILKELREEPKIFAKAICLIIETLKNIEDIEKTLNGSALQCFFIDNKKAFVAMVYSYFSKKVKNLKEV